MIVIHYATHRVNCLISQNCCVQTLINHTSMTLKLEKTTSLSRGSHQPTDHQTQPASSLLNIGQKVWTV